MTFPANPLPNDDWNDVPDPNQAPQYEPPSPQEPFQPAPDFATSDSFFSPEPAAPVPPTIRLYVPVNDVLEPYPTAQPQYQEYNLPPASQPQNIPPAQPVKKDKSKGWIIALIIFLVLIVCVLIGIGIVFILLASGEYRLEWGAQPILLLSQWM